jgi:hypothetical protein
VPAAARREAVSIVASACSAKGSYLVIAHAAADIAPGRLQRHRPQTLSIRA